MTTEVQVLNGNIGSTRDASAFSAARPWHYRVDLDKLHYFTVELCL